ncbi:DUF4244 domain-containing protein [Streptomyces netropsis]
MREAHEVQVAHQAHEACEANGRGDQVMVVQWWSKRWARLRVAGEDGMTTAEYAVGTLAACALAAVLYKVVTSGAVSSALQALIVKALHASF